MVRFTLTGTVAALLGILATPAIAQRDDAQALSHEFGRVRQGTIVRHQFALPAAVTKGDRISRVEVSQPGMKARFKPDVSAECPAVVRLEWDTAVLQGPVKGEAFVRWENAAAPVVRLTLRGHVAPLIEIQPLPAAFFSVFHGESAERVLTLVNHDERPVTIRGIDAKSQHFNADIDVVEPGRRFDVHVRVPENAPVGRVMESLTVRTDHPERPEIIVPVNVLVKEDVYANPEEADFGGIDRAALARTPAVLDLMKQVFMVKRRQGPFQLTSVSCDIPGVKVAYSPTEKESAIFKFEVGLEPSRLMPGPLVGTISIRTSDERFPEIAVPVRGLVR
ncbi:MAG: hypothetical protein GEU99_16095 [Luteitalea sp.]|nr:hypothetical protein [Luteitalea sp.]